MRKLPAAAILLFMLVPAAWVADRLLSRPDRRRYAQRRAALLAVHDQLLRYEYEHGSLPNSLADLVPHYLNAGQLCLDGQPAYRYERATRTIAMATKFRVRGLYLRHWPPASMVLPPPAAPTPAPPVVDQHAALILPAGDPPTAVAPPAGALVFEAEHYTAMNYGWELVPDPDAGGGAYIHIKEGMANSSGQETFGTGDFYNIHDNRELTFLRYHFHLPRAGTYYFYGRMWTTGSHCSNNLSIALDRGGPRIGSMHNQTPFRWVWTQIHHTGPQRLEAGDHFLHVFPHEDGIRVDQFIISPVPISGNAVYRTNFETGRGTTFIQQAEPFHLTFDLKSMVITPNRPPHANLAIRRIRGGAGPALLRLRLADAGPNGETIELARRTLDLDKLPALVFVPIDFSRIAVSRLPRREYLLTAELTQATTTVARAHVPLMRPYRWFVLGPVDYVPNGERGPFDGSAPPAAGQHWQPFKDEAWDHFGVLDFGLQTIGNSLNAPAETMIYAQTKIRVPATADYLFKIQSDDQLLLWIDGELVARQDTHRPVTRAPYRALIRLTRGDHVLRLRVNQGRVDRWGDGRWQACLRIRTAKDLLSDVIGLP